MNVPSARPAALDARLLEGAANDRSRFVEQLREACRDVGTFYLTGHSVPAALCACVLEETRAFFALPSEDKALIDIKGSRHFRGYSRMCNERDWREQVHFGPELPAVAHDAAFAYWRLQGPNLWPSQLGADWRETMLSFLREIDTQGRRLLAAVETAAGLPAGYFDCLAGDSPYLLMKLICYYPQPGDQCARSGVAPHCDWSWLTFLLQDTAGLEVQTRDGEWLAVPPVTDALIVSVGELTEIVTSGTFRATPHRVHNLSRDRPRVSVPVFINPSLNAVVASPLPQHFELAASEDPAGHVHRVANPREPAAPFVFGDSEWRRKGLGRWCFDEKCLGI